MARYVIVVSRKDEKFGEYFVNFWESTQTRPAHISVDKRITNAMVLTPRVVALKAYQRMKDIATENGMRLTIVEL